MTNACPNKSHPDWKAIVAKYDEKIAYAAYLSNNEVIPTVEYVDENIEIIYPRVMHDVEAEQKRLISNKSRARLLRQAVENHLAKMKIGVGVLDNIEQDLDDPEAQRTIAYGIREITRVAEGAESNMALPETYARLVVESLKNSPFYSRLYNALSRDENALRGVFERDEEGSYEAKKALYKDDKDSLVKEAMDKLILRHFLQQVAVEPGQAEAHILDKFLADAKRIWSVAPATELTDTLMAADDSAHAFVDGLLEGSMDVEFTYGSEGDAARVGRVERDLERSKKLLESLLQQEATRVKLTAAGNKGMATDAEKKGIREAKARYISGDYVNGITGLLDTIVQNMKQIQQKIAVMREARERGAIPLRDISRTLRDMKRFIDAYDMLSKEISIYLVSDEYKALNAEANGALSLESIASGLFAEKERIMGQYKSMALSIASNFLSGYLGSLKGQEFNGEVVTEDTVTQWLLETTGQVGFLNRWVTAMTESSDVLLRLIAEPVQRARFKARNREITVIRELQAAREKLEKVQGNADTAFMYETYIYTDPATGEKRERLSGRYVTEINWGQYLHDLENERKRIKETHHISDEDFKDVSKWPDAARADLIKFTSERRERAGSSWQPKKSIYGNPAFARMTPAQREYYKEIVAIKKSLDNHLPAPRSTRLFMPQVRKDWYERVRDAKGVKSLGKMFLGGVADKWIVKEDELEYYSEKDNEMLEGFDGHPVDRLPIPFRRVLKNPDLLSTDATSAMIQYASMAINYDEMNKIVDSLEIVRDVMSDRKIYNVRPDGTRDVRKATYMGVNITQQVFKEKGTYNFLTRLNDYFTMQVYGKYQSREIDKKVGKNKSINSAKIMNNMMQLTSLNTYALNLLAGVSNVLTGNMMMRIDAVAKEFFNYKDMLKADSLYARQLGDILSDVGRRRPRTKISLLLEKFNVLQDREAYLKDMRENRKNLFTRNLRLSSLFYLQTCGEHYMQSRTFLSIAHSIKFKDANGREINLWDAFEVKTNANGVERVELKEGVTNIDGTPVSDKDLYLIEQKSKRINQKLHGIYNREDMSAFQRLSFGRMVFMFRKWMIPAYNRRWQKKNWSFQLDQEEEGYYMTTSRFIWSLIKEKDERLLHAASKFKTLTPHERANIRRAITEVGEFMALFVAYMLLMSDEGPDDDDYAYNMLKYQVARLKSEMAIYTPTPALLNELLSLNSSIPTLDYTRKLVNALFGVQQYFDDPLRSGRFKGYRPWVRNWVSVLPLQNPIYRALHPDEAMQFFTFGKR